MNMRRIDNAVAALSAAEAYLVTSQADVQYLTGVNLDGYWLLLTRKENYVFTSPLLADHLRSLLPGMTVVSGSPVPGLFIDFCRKRKLRTVTLDEGNITCALGRKLQSYLKIQQQSHTVAALRQVKDEQEIEIIRKSCAITVGAMDSVKKLLKPGASEEYIGFKIEEYFAKHGARMAFLPIVACGPNSANPHHLTAQRKIAENDVILVDIGCTYNGYCSDLTRTFFLGKITNFHKQIYALVKSAHDRAIRSIHAGVKARAVDAVARTCISKGGYGRRFIHTTGHGVGIEIHEAPRLGRTDASVLRAGMVVTVEPGIYLPGKFGVRIEDTVFITEKGTEVLTA